MKPFARPRRRVVTATATLIVAAAAVTVGATAAAAGPRGDDQPDSTESVTTSPGAGPATITGPIPSTAQPGDPSHNYVFYSTPFDLKRAGYVEQEFFISGTATRYSSNPTVDQQGQTATSMGTTP